MFSLNCALMAIAKSPGFTFIFPDPNVPKNCDRDDTGRNNGDAQHAEQKQQ
jgi:hypothetical protein